MYLKFAFLLGCIHGFSLLAVAQDTIKKWEIDSFQVYLIKYQQVQETAGIFIYKEKPPRFSKIFVVEKNKKPIQNAGTLEVSKDSSKLAFLELPNPRMKNGKVGIYQELDLRQRTLKSTIVSKPVWKYSDIDSITMKPLDSLIYNAYNPHLPYVVNKFDQGQARKLHPKNVEGFVLFFQEAYLTAKYIKAEFSKPHTPTFELTIYTQNKTDTVLFYWGRFIVNGYIYGGGSYSDLFELRFWDSNLQLMGN